MHLGWEARSEIRHLERAVGCVRSWLPRCERIIDGRRARLAPYLHVHLELPQT